MARKKYEDAISQFHAVAYYCGIEFDIMIDFGKLSLFSFFFCFFFVFFVYVFFFFNFSLSPPSSNGMSHYLYLLCRYLSSPSRTSISSLLYPLYYYYYIPSPLSFFSFSFSSLGLCEAHMAMNNFKVAISTAKAALKSSPKNPKALALIGLVLLNTQTLEGKEKAIVAFKRAMQMDPDYLEPYVHLSSIYSADGKHPEVCRILPINMTTYCLLVLLLYHLFTRAGYFVFYFTFIFIFRFIFVFLFSTGCCLDEASRSTFFSFISITKLW